MLIGAIIIFILFFVPVPDVFEDIFYYFFFFLFYIVPTILIVVLAFMFIGHMY